MTPRYVYSLNSRARLAHLGSNLGTRCGYVLMSTFDFAETLPPDRALCSRCARLAGADPVAAADPGGAVAARDAVIVGLLREGLDNAGVARRLRVGLRTAVRWIGDAQGRAGASNRWTWGYAVGRGEAGG